MAIAIGPVGWHSSNLHRRGVLVVRPDEAIAVPPNPRHLRGLRADHRVNPPELPADLPGNFKKQRLHRHIRRRRRHGRRNRRQLPHARYPGLWRRQSRCTLRRLRHVHRRLVLGPGGLRPRFRTRLPRDACLHAPANHRRHLRRRPRPLRLRRGLALRLRRVFHLQGCRLPRPRHKFLHGRDHRQRPFRPLLHMHPPPPSCRSMRHIRPRFPAAFHHFSYL